MSVTSLYNGHFKIIEWKKIASSKTQTCVLHHTSPVSSYCATPYTKSQNENTGHKKQKKLDNVKIGNLKRKNRDHKKST